MASELPPAPVTMYIDTVRRVLTAPGWLRCFAGAFSTRLSIAQELVRHLFTAAQLPRENEVFIQAVHEAQRDGRVREMAIYLERLTSSVARLGKLMDLQTLQAAQLPERREVRVALAPVWCACSAVRAARRAGAGCSNCGRLLAAG